MTHNNLMGALFGALFFILITASIGAVKPTLMGSTRGAAGVPAGDAHFQKMNSQLLEARAAVVRGGIAKSVFASHHPHAMRSGRLQVIIACNNVRMMAKACSAAGLDVVETHDTDYGMKHVVVHVDDPLDLDPIVADANATLIYPELQATAWAGSVGNQAEHAMRAGMWDGIPATMMGARGTYGIDGTGVRVGVISDSFSDTRGGAVVGGFLTGNLDQASGDLPASVRMIDPGPGGGTDEGNGMAQLIFDIAPGSDIAFASAFTSFPMFSANITSLHTDAMAPSDIIVDDVLYFAEPVYQDGFPALAYEGAFAAGIPCFSSAGNNNANGHESPYLDIDGGTDEIHVAPKPFPSGVDLHDFGGGDTFLELSLSAGSPLTITLHWNEPYAGGAGPGPGAAADLDLFLLSTAAPPSPGNTITASFTSQGISPASRFGEPFEIISIGSPITGPAFIAVNHAAGIDPSVVLVTVDAGGSNSVVETGLLGDRTLYGHSAAENVMSVGAMLYFEWETDAFGAATGFADGAFSGSPATFDVESFSALGGSLPFFYDATGAAIPTAFRPKPNFTALDGCDTTFFGSPSFEPFGPFAGTPNFFGTSAAAPNAAAVAALMMEHAADDGITRGARAFSAGLLYDEMTATAIEVKSGLPVETPGFDALSGAGVIDALAAAMTPEALFVVLNSFSASSEEIGDPVVVRWETTTEVDNAGFDLYRVSYESGYPTVGEKLTSSIIPAAGGVGVLTQYDFTDTVPLAEGDFGTRGYYLEDIDLKGRRTLHSPIFVQDGRALLSVSNWDKHI